MKRRTFLKTLGIVGIAATFPVEVAIHLAKSGLADQIKINGDYTVVSGRDFDRLNESLPFIYRFSNSSLLVQGVDNLIFKGKPVIDARSLKGRRFK